MQNRQKELKWREDQRAETLRDTDLDKMLGSVTEIEYKGKWAAHVPGFKRSLFDSKQKAKRVVEQYVKSKFG